MSLTPKLLEGVRLAHAAAGHTLNRCRGGWYDRSHYLAPQGAPTVTTRTANALVEMGLAEYDCDALPSSLTLTAAGIAEASPAQPMQAAA